MRLTLKPGEHLRLACDSKENTFAVTIGKGFLHIVANDPGEQAQVVIAATESARVTAGQEAAEER